MLLTDGARCRRWHRSGDRRIAAGRFVRRGRCVRRRREMHRLPRRRQPALLAHDAREDLPPQSEDRARAAGVRGVPRSRLEARRERARQGRHHRLHARVGHAGRRPERAMPRLPRRRPAHVLGRLDACAEPHRVQRLPQSDGAAVEERPPENSAHFRHLRALPPTAARGVPAPLAHAAARRQDELRRLSQPARLGHAPAAQGRQRQRDLHRVPRREARPVPVGARARARELRSTVTLPHGSNHDFLLVGARPFVCQQCHSPPLGHPGAFFNASQTAAAAQQPGGTQSARVIGRACQNCHSQIHGSNHPSGARFQR